MDADDDSLIRIAYRYYDNRICSDSVKFLINYHYGRIYQNGDDYQEANAEYAISTRRIARGKGINMLASNLIINYGFNELNLNKIYLNVLSKNERAIKFYKKIGFKHEGTIKQHLYMYSEYYDLEWYAIIRGDRT